MPLKSTSMVVTAPGAVREYVNVATPTALSWSGSDWAASQSTTNVPLP